MAVRGAEAKELVTKVLLTVFKDSFINEKEIRIPVMWDGEEIQIKVALTASKTNVEHNGSTPVKPSLPKETADVVPIGVLTEEQKAEILKSLMGIIDVELNPIGETSSTEEIPF